MCLQKVVNTAKVYTYVRFNDINYTVILYIRSLTGEVANEKSYTHQLVNTL